MIGAIVAGLFGRAIGAKASEYVTSGLMIIAASCPGSSSSPSACGHAEGGPIKVEVLRWIQSGGIDVYWSLRIDTLTVVMLVVVNTVSTLVHVYSIGYMRTRSASAALLRLSLALHLRHADAGDR